MKYNGRLIVATLQTKNDDFKKKIRETFSKDRIAQDILENFEDNDNFDEQDRWDFDIPRTGIHSCSVQKKTGQQVPWINTA